MSIIIVSKNKSQGIFAFVKLLINVNMKNFVSRFLLVMVYLFTILQPGLIFAQDPADDGEGPPPPPPVPIDTYVYGAIFIVLVVGFWFFHKNRKSESNLNLSSYETEL